MTFAIEEVPKTGPSRLAAEHRTLVAWMTTSRIGVIEYLDQRMVDPDVPAAFYYIQGIGMGDGQRFALVCGDAIYVVSVYGELRTPSAGPSRRRIGDVSVPEAAPMSRGAIESLLTEALHDYFQAHPYMLRTAISNGTQAEAFDWNAARWRVRPRKYSLLYWRTRCDKALQEFRTRVWPRIWGTVTSPVAAALCLATFAWAGETWPTALSGAWLALRLMQYEAEWRLGAWMVGRLKYRNPLSALYATGRMMNPVPLAAITVRVEPVEGEPMMRIVRVVNRSWVPVPYVFITAHSLAELLAPGFIEQLRRQGRQGVYDSKELERHFPVMVKKWLWSGRSFACRHQLLADFPCATPTHQIQALVNIPRFVSKESRPGPTTYLLAVEEFS